MQNQTRNADRESDGNETGKPCSFVPLIGKVVAWLMSQSESNERLLARDGIIFINNFAQNDGYDVRRQAYRPNAASSKAYPERRA